MASIDKPSGSIADIYIYNHLDLFSTFFSCTRYSTPSVEAVRRSRKSSCDLDSFDTREVAEYCTANVAGLAWPI